MLQFINAGDPVLPKSMLLAAIHFSLGMLWLSLITLLLERVRHWITHPRMQRRIEVVTGTLSIGFGLRLALERR